MHKVLKGSVTLFDLCVEAAFVKLYCHFIKGGKSYFIKFRDMYIIKYIF